MNYFVKFQSGNELIITQEDYKRVLRMEYKNIFVRLEHIDYMIPAESDPRSGIVKPPSPAELKAQEERNKEADDITLEGQLSKL